MKLYNLQLTLLNSIYTQKENRLIFDGDAPGAAPAPAQAEKPAPKPEDKETVEVKDLTPEALKASINSKITVLNTRMDEIIANTKKEYSDEMVAKMKTLKTALDLLKGSVTAISASPETKDQLAGFYASTRTMEDNVSADLLESKKVAIKKDIDTIQTELAPELIAAEIAKQAGAGKIPEADIQALNIFLETYFTSLKGQIDAIAPADLEKELPALQARIDGVTAQVVAEKYIALITANKGGELFADIAEIATMEAKSPEAQKIKQDAIVDFAGHIISGETDAITPERLAQIKAAIEAADKAAETSSAQKEVYTRAAEILNDPEITAENIASAVANYEPGMHDNGVESKNYKNIISKLIANKDKLQEAGINIDFLGGTDGMRHKLIKDAGWHENKAAALTKLLEIQAAGNLEGTSIDAAQMPLIEAYIAAANASKGYEFVRDSKDQELFLNGQGIFDKALALQRAEKAHKEIYDYPINAKTHVVLEIGDHQDDVTQRKSGVRLSQVEEKESQIANPDTITMTPAELADILGPIGDKWRKNPDHPSQRGKGKETDPGLCNEDGTIGKNDGPAGPDYYQKDGDVWKKIVVTEDGKPPAPPEKRETATDHIYELDGNVLKVTFKGEAESTSYNLILPDGFSKEVKVSPDGKGSYLRVGSGDLKGGLTFDDQKALATHRPQNEALNIWGKYDVKEEKGTITVTLKPALVEAVKFDETKVEATKADLLEQIEKLNLDFNGLGSYETASRQQFVHEIMLAAKIVGKMPGVNFIQNMGFKKDEKVDYGFGKQNDAMTRRILIALNGKVATPASVEAVKFDEKEKPDVIQHLQRFDESKSEATKADLMAQIEELGLDFKVTGSSKDESRAKYESRAKFVEKIMVEAKNKGKMPGVAFVLNMGFKKGEKVDYGKDGNPEMTARINAALDGVVKSPAHVSKTRAALLDEIKALKLDFNDVNEGEDVSRARFVDEIIKRAKAAGVKPGEGFIARLGYKEGDSVNFGKQLTWSGNVDVEKDNAVELAKVDNAINSMKTAKDS